MSSVICYWTLSLPRSKMIR